MERARHRKSKSASGIEGVPRIQKYKAVTSLSSDPCSYIDGSTGNDKFTLELGQSSSGRATGRLMTKLLAEEMYKGIQSRRRSRSVIARLMGLEGLPSLWHVHRPKKRSSDNYQQKNVSIRGQPNRQLYDDLSDRRSPMGRQESNDGYEDLKASYFVNPRSSSRWSASSMLTNSEMELIQKFIDAKRHSANETMDEKLHDSKELDDTLDMLYSKEDLLMRSVRQPDSLLANNLHDLLVTPSSSIRSHTIISKPRSSGKYEGGAKVWVSERDTKGKHNITSHPKRKDGLLLEPQNQCRARISHKSLNIQPEEKNEKNILPTRIVVLRPNLGNMSSISGSSPDHSHGYVPNFREMKEYARVGGAEKLSWRRNDSSHYVGFSKPISREGREIAKEITRRMRGGYDETVDAKFSGFREYAGDESSYDARESDSDGELGMLPSRTSFEDGNKWDRYPSSSSVEWSVNREAKKRLSERWRTTHRYQDLEIVGEGSTLGEMLSVADGEIRSNNYPSLSLGRASAQLGSYDGSVMWDDPLGISSRDSRKDENHRTSSRLRSLPPPVGGRSHRRGAYHDELAEEKNMMCSDPIHSGRSKVTKGNLSHKEIFSSQDSKSRSKKPHPRQQNMYTNEINSLTKANFEIQMEANIKDVSEQQLMFEMAAKYNSSGSQEAIAEHGSTALSSKSSALHPKQSSFADDDKAAAHDQEGFCLQELEKRPPEEGSCSSPYLGAELVPVESLRETDHASPVSVLEVPFMEDASSSSESVERVSAERNDLRMQLQLLKMEAGAYAELSTVVTTEEDAAQLSMLSNGNYIVGAEGWEISYALDILIHSGLQESGFDVFKIMWYSPDSPLDPNLFDKLEKKFGDETTEMRPERKMLFDRINSALFDIFQQHVDIYPWVMPKLTGLNSKLQKERVKDALEKLINEASVNGQLPERMLDKEMQWQDYKAEVDGIGKEIEKLLIDDMITEFLCNY